MSIRSTLCLVLILPALAASVAVAQYEVSWHTIDGGGAMFSTGGTFSLGGTIGQSDASPSAAPLSGGSFELVGGFWAFAEGACPCLGDVNGDGARDGRDVRYFVGCLTTGGSCTCADMDGAGGATVADVPLFVAALLGGAACQ